MGRKKADIAPSAQVTRPFCYFCDRAFNDENVLIQHQRARHFKCLECDADSVRGKCESVQGLMVHTLKVHNKPLAKVPNAMPGRDKPEFNVYGMDGVPAEVLRQKGFTRDDLLGKVDTPPLPSDFPPPQTAGMEAPIMPTMPGALPGMAGLPPMPGPGSGPSLSGFQQFLAIQKTAPLQAPGMPGVSPQMPGAANGFVGAVGGYAPQAAPLALPLLAPGQPIGSSGAPSQLVPQKRRLEEEEAAGEDVSVEERRAFLERYRIPRS